MPIPRWKWLEKVGATEEAEKEKAKPIPKPTVIEKTVSKTTTARRRRLEHTQEFKDIGRPSVSEPKPKPTVIDQHKQTDAGKLAFIRSITGHGKENIPEKIRDLGPSAEREYAVTTYKTQRGIIPYEQGIERIQSGFETRLRKGSEPTSIRWMKEHGTFTSDGKAYTWSEIKEKHPRLEIKREFGEFVIYEKPIDYTAWREEQYKDMDPFSTTVRRGAATFLGGFANWDYIFASQTGDPTDITKQQGKLGTIIDKWEYDTIHNIESGNILGVATGIPAVTNIVLPYAGGIVLGKGLKVAGGISALLKKPVVYTCIGGPTSTGLPYKIFTGTVKVGLAAIGAVAVGSAGIDVFQTYQTDPDKALVKALTYGTQFFSFGRGVKLGMAPKIPKIEPENRFLFKKGWETESKTASKNLDNLFKTAKTTGFKPKPFVEITQRGGSTTIFRPGTTDFYTPVQTGKTISLTKVKTVTTTPTAIPKVITISPTMTAKLSFSIMKPISGFKKIKGGGVLGKIWGRRLSLEMLAASESGVYTGVHPYWLGVIPILKTALEPMTVTIPKYGFDIGVKNLQLQLPQHTSLLDNITSIQTENVGQISRQIPSFLTDTMIKTDTISATKNILDIDTITQTIQESISKTITTTITEPISVVSSSYYYPFPLSSPYVPSGHYKKKKKRLEIEGARKRVHPITLLKIPKIPFQEVNI